MRRSTQNNFSHLIKEELVKRFEGVVKEEIRKHNLAIAKTDCQISDLKKQLDVIQNRFKVVEDKTAHNCQELRSQFFEEKKNLEKNFSDTRDIYSERKKSIEEMQENIELLLLSHVPKEEYDAFVERTNLILKNYNDIIQIDRKNAKNDLEVLKNRCELSISESLKKFENILSDMNEKLSEFESKLQTNIVDAAGISRMLKIEQKSIFIIEKKIEDLYTLNKRIIQQTEDRG